jgi:hypothetical protein
MLESRFFQQFLDTRSSIRAFEDKFHGDEELGRHTNLFQQSEREPHNEAAMTKDITVHHMA